MTYYAIDLKLHTKKVSGWVILQKVHHGLLFQKYKKVIKVIAQKNLLERISWIAFSWYTLCAVLL